MYLRGFSVDWGLSVWEGEKGDVEEVEDSS